MTHEQKIEAISNKIREDLPYLMELSEGCLIEDINNNDIHKVNSFHIQVGYVIRLHTTDLSNYFGGGCSFNYIPKHHKIIGHEPKLNDVLAWLINCHPKVRWFRVKFHKLGGGYEGEWNLEKPYLKDQSVELIDFLYSLIDNEN